MVIEYSLPRIPVISSYIIANKTLILSIFCKNGGSRKKTHVVEQNEIYTAIVSQT